MLGFTPLSTNPISDNKLPAITGTLYAVDQNDTANINGYELDTGYISATDQNDTASITGSVVSAGVVGSINVTDQNDTANIQGTVANPSTMDMHDGFTKKEYERLKRIQKKIAQAERKKLEAYKAAQEARKSAIKELVDPSPKRKEKENKVQFIQEVSADIPSDLTKFDDTIARLVKEQEQLVQAAFYRNELARIQTQLAILEAKRVQDLDDEEALLLLL
jgi:inorganic pyrophosphatase